MPAQSLDHKFEQDKDTKRINEGEETTDDDVPWESHKSYDNLEGETVSNAQFNVLDVRDNETKYGDDIETQVLTGFRIPLTNLGEKTHHPLTPPRYSTRPGTSILLTTTN